MRLFIGVSLLENQRVEVRRLQQRLQLYLDEVRWVSPEGMHITLKFLGETDPGLLPAITEAIRRAAKNWAGFEFRLRGLGVFPGQSRARVIWAGIQEGYTEIETLNSRLETELGSPDFPKESRPFHPHLTLGRAGSPLPRDLIALALNREKEFATPLGKIDRIVLFRSHLARQGAKYESVYEEILADYAGKRQSYPE